MNNQFDVHRDKIIKYEPLKQTMVYDYKKWSDWLKQVKYSLQNELSEVDSKFNGKISRDDLVKYAESLNNDKTVKHSIQFFLACMMWGYGGDLDKKNSDFRGPYRVKQILNSSEEVKENIHEAFCSISNGNIEIAFRKLSKIKGLSISFLSKFLYFASRGCKIEKYALIFDVRVAKGIIQLISNRNDLVNIVSITPSIEYEGFKKYLDFAHELGKRYECEAENIELFLFEQANRKEF